MKRTALVSVVILAVVLLFSCAGMDTTGVGGSVPEKRSEERSEDSVLKMDDDSDLATATGVPAEMEAGAPAGAPAPAPARGSSKEAMPSVSMSGDYREVPSASGLKAGFSDDNAQFNYFVNFLKEYGDVEHFAYDISERITLKVLDSAGKPVANAAVAIAAGGTTLVSGLTSSDGAYRLYPAALGSQAASYTVRVESGTMSAGAEVRRDGERVVELRLAKPRSVPTPLPLDILFVMDTTGSMGEEIQRLKATMEIIHDNLGALKPRPALRFGLVLYKDRGDEYVTKVVPFTADLGEFRAALDPVQADGGGDGPEDLESALDDAVNAMDWNDDGLRLGFVVTDAEAHLDYGREYTYIDAASDARARAIKLYTIGTGGLPLEGEYLLRQVSQLTNAKYIFLTYGERGESEGGAEGSVSHHTGANFQTDKLEAIIIRFVKEEVSNLSDTPLSMDEEYYSARKVDDEARDETIDKLFGEALDNLADYSTYRITADTPCVVLPVTVSGDGIAATAEYFGERLAMASVTIGRWKPVERKDFQKILAELELQLSGLVDEGSAAKVGELLGADVLVASSLFRRDDQYELYLRLVRVSTAEVLAVSRAKIAVDLGL
ncbi:MAG: VWA domain-containing protein [Spirochaetales bacterium]|nr:VWA domain-containing protein [Spirochaetales bacterium]